MATILEVAGALSKAITPSERLPAAMYEIAAKYLKNFGYLDDLTTAKPAEVTAVVKEAQETLNVTPDGKVGPITIKQMEVLPRCGCSDTQSARGELNRWAPSKSGALSYHIVNYVPNFSKQRSEDLLVQAWTAWEKVCGIRLVRKKSTSADIIIDCSASRQEEFGTVGNVLAWAELPQGENTRQLLMKFDLAENWVDDPNLDGMLFLNVATHEFGHLIGEDHTQIKGELMFPIYSRGIWLPQGQYDIPQAVLRYGQSAAPPTPAPVPDDLSNRVRVTIDGKVYRLTL